MDGKPRARTAPPREALLAAAAVLTGCVIAALWLPVEDFSGRVSNPLQAAAAGAAASSMAWRAVRSRGRRRTGSLLLAVGCACWCAGQLVWVQAIIAGRGVPFPSVADVGFLLFPLLAAVALWTAPAADGGRGRWQRISDAVTTTAALGLVSWQTTLGTVVAGTSSSPVLERVLLLAYPVTDVLLAVLTVLTLSRSRRDRAALGWLGAGLVALATSDSAFTYLQAAGSYEGGLVDCGWIAGFLLIALSGTVPSSAAGALAAAPADPLRVSFLPYVPLVLATTSTVVFNVAGRPLGRAELAVACGLVAVLLARQYGVLRENTRLAAELAGREALLRHQAFHDALTGLANRALFHDRLGHALQRHARDLRPLALVFLDLDGFKGVNDTLGHAAGDELLVRLAERLLGAVRGGDTVARLGGDEFAVLLENEEDPYEVAARAVRALDAPFLLGGQHVRVSASVGVTTLGPEAPPVDADELLARSDAAMYTAKRAGGGRVVDGASVGR